MDGARLLNAVVASGVEAPAFGRLCDSLWLDFSKGLGCPVGAVLAGSKAFIAEAWVWKHRLGGALRQAGVLAGACLYALDHHVDRLAEDHANAALLARLVAEIPGVALEFAETHTNIVFIDVQGTGHSAFAIADRLREHGVRFSIESAQRLRALTHLDVSRADVETAASVLREVLRTMQG
jgi:threonine aldolase